MATKPKTTPQTTGNIAEAKGKLGIMIPGMGAVATTFVAGVEAVRKGIAKPIGSLTQMGTIRLGKRTDALSPKIKEFVPLASLNDLVFTGWDIFEDNMYAAASNAGVLERDLLEQIKPFLTSITPRKAVFDHNYVKKIDGPNVKKGKNKMDLAEQVRADMRDFKKTSGASRLVTIWCGSTESFIEPTAAHQSLKSFEKALTQNDEMIAPSMIYAYASLMEGVPFANGAPNLTVDLPVLEHILQPELYPELYGKFTHKVRINYYPPRGDNKEGWDNIDIFGWLGYPMQIKVDFLCRDSILAAPLVLDLALFFDLAHRAGLSGIQEWLSFYFKSPQTAPGLYPENDLFIQHTKLKNTLRWMMGEDQITHLGIEYYEKA